MYIVQTLSNSLGVRHSNQKAEFSKVLFSTFKSVAVLKNMLSALVAMASGSMINGSPSEGESGGVGLLLLLEEEAESWKSISSAAAMESNGLE